MTEHNFDLGPSEEYKRRKEAFDAVQKEFSGTRAAGCSDDEWQRLAKGVVDAYRALREMPEHHDIKQLEKDTTDTYLGRAIG
jgi:hypothetical protein